jgi:hypothetical protein
LYPTDTLSLSFDPLEFSTSPLPPSSPLPSSTAHGSLLSLCQTPHTAGKACLDLDRIPLSSGLSDPHEVGSSQTGFSRGVTPDLPSTPRWRHSPRTSRLHNAPSLLASSSKDELIPDLLMRDDPWNVIGDILDLPRIPPADPTYFSKIVPLPARAQERGLSFAPSPPNISMSGGVPCSHPRDEDNWLRAAHSDEPGLPPIRPISSRVRSKHSASSPLLSRNSLDKRSFRTFRSGAVSGLPNYVERDAPSPSSANGDLPILTEAFQPPPELRAPLTSPRALDCSSMSRRRSSSDLVVKTPSSGSGFVTLQRSTLPSPKQLSPPKMAFASHSPKILAAQWNAISDIDLDLLIPKVLMTQTTNSRTQLLNLECPELFKDEEDGFEGIF